MFLDTHLRASHHTRFGTLAEHPGLPAADDVITQKGQSWRAARVSEKTQKRFKHTERGREGETEGRGEREVEVRRPKHGNKSAIQVFGAALTGGRMVWGGGGGGKQVHLKGRAIKSRRTR